MKLFDILHLNGRDLIQEGVPLLERKALLRSAYVRIPRFVEEVDWSLVDLATQSDAISEHFEAARARGEEGLMIKAAARAYVPNARTNVVKLKTEFIPGLGDTVTLMVVGARYARRVGSGAGAALVCELACAAPCAKEVAVAPSLAGPFTQLTWLFNTAALSYKESSGLSSAAYEQLLRRLNEEIITGAPADSALRSPLMRRLGQHEALPSWLLHAPEGRARRPHFVLTDPATAVKVEVLGSRFLTRFVNDDDAVKVVPWKLRFPRVVRWFSDAAGLHGTIPDTLESYRLKGCEAWLAQRGRTWPSIAEELSGDLGVDAEERAILNLGTGADSALPPAPDSALPRPKRPRTADGPSTGCNGVESGSAREIPTTAILVITEGHFEVARGCRTRGDWEGALHAYRQATALFEGGRGNTGLTGQELIHHALIALSGVAGSLETLSKVMRRAMSNEEVREALRMRLRASCLCREHYATLPPDQLEQLHGKLTALCKRDEVRLILHGLLVARMERAHGEARVAKEAGHAFYIGDSDAED